jgi:DNA-binding transcriptional ArsR family regulator
VEKILAYRKQSEVRVVVEGSYERDLLILLQPMRMRIIKVLREAGKPLYIREIADRLGEDWKIVSYHLTALADAGFVEGEFRVIEPPKSNPRVVGKAGKFYRLTIKVDEVLNRLNELRI